MFTLFLNIGSNIGSFKLNSLLLFKCSDTYFASTFSILSVDIFDSVSSTDDSVSSTDDDSSTEKHKLSNSSKSHPG